MSESREARRREVDVKPHLIVKLRKPIDRHVRSWEEIISDKSDVPTSFSASVDHLLHDSADLPYWLATNYRPRGRTWSESECARGFDRVYRLILQRNTSIPPRIVDRLRLLPEVEDARPGLVVAASIPDSRYVSTTSLARRYRTNNTYLQEAHQFSQGHPDVKIAVLDTGFETDHPEIETAMLPGRDFVDIASGATQFFGDFMGVDDEPDDGVGHGTHVAGIIAGRGLKMPIGVVSKCRVLPVKVLGALKRGESVVGAGLIDNINNGIKWAVDQGADVINMSLGIKHQGGGLPHEEVIRYALDQGVTVVAASGNDGTEDLYYPGALPGVIAVGAADDRGAIAPFSTFGGHVSLIAPGVNIYSTHLNRSYAISSGTSQAAPFVSGAVALLKAMAMTKGKQLSNSQIMYLLKHTSDKVSGGFKDLKAGFGHLNLLDALKLLQYKL